MAMALAVVVPSHVAAQSGSAGSTQGTDDLRRRIEELERAMKAQIEALRLQLAQQEAELARLRPTAATPPASPGAPTAAQTSGRGVISAPDAQETFNREQESVARVDNVPIDPALTGFFQIPNTPARLKIDGYAKLDTIIDARPAGNQDSFNVGSIPINLSGPERVTNTNVHARQTRVNLDFRSPTSLNSEFRAFPKSISSAAAARSIHGCGISTASWQTS